MSTYCSFFYESFNKRSKHGQIGIIITTIYVATCYYHSVFMGKFSTKDVFESFTACLSGISKSKLLQVCSDSPNVNLSFRNLLEKDRNEKELSQILHIGTFGLHTLQHWNMVKEQLVGMEKSCYHLCTEYFMSHHLEELIMRHLNKQHL